MTVTKRKPKPITAHPLFPVVTALWFATFFGLGSFAIAPSLLEGPVVALGLPAIVPAATPPLGFTARVMLAVAMLLLGGVTGYLVGRRLAPREAAAPRRRDVAAARSQERDSDAQDSLRRPLNPAEDLGEPLMADAEGDAAPLRRRALSLTDEGQPMMPSEDAPLPGYLPWEQPDEAQDPVGQDLDLEQDPLALQGLFEAAQSAERFVPISAPFAPPPEYIAPEEFTPAPMAMDEPAAAALPEVREPALVANPLLQAPAARVTPLDRAPLEGLGLVQLVERLAVAISRRTPPARDAAPLESSAFALPPAVEMPAAPVAATPADAPPFSAMAPAPVVEAPREIQRVVPLRPFAAELPAALQHDDPEQDEPTEQAAELARFLRAPKTPVEETSEALPAEPEVAEDCYPSLLDMGPVASRFQAPRIDDGLGLGSDACDEGIEPTVVFPGQVSALQAGLRRFERPSIQPVQGSPLAAPGQAAPSSPIESLPAETFSAEPGHTQAMPAGSVSTAGTLPDPEEADRALRAALATLQRMTAQG